MALSQLGFKYFLKFDYISSRSFYPALKKDLFGKNLNIQRFTFLFVSLLIFYYPCRPRPVVQRVYFTIPSISHCKILACFLHLC